MKKKLITLGITLLTVVNITALGTIAYHRFSHCEERHHENQHDRRDFLHRELGLSDVQAEQMKILRESFHSNSRSIRAALRAKRKRLLQLLTAAETNRAKIGSVQSEIDSLQAELQELVIDHLLDERKILTVEQQSKFFLIIRERLMMEESHHEQNSQAPISE